MERWVLLRKGADYQEIGRKFQIPPRVACLIRNRDVIGDEAINLYLNGTIADLYDGMLMADMDKAVDILIEKREQKASVRVIGDYDIDGVNASYILLEAFEKIGIDVDVDIPDRITDGYGLNKNLIDKAFEDGIDTIVTCDNGIAAAEEIAYAKKLGMTVIVTDHHEVPFMDGEERTYILPPADAVVDPKRKDCQYPFDGLCGAAVAYKLAEALFEALGEDASDLDYLLENVGIATVGDVMDLQDENRIFVKQALEMLGHTGNLGLRALMEVTGVNPQAIGSYHIGFVIGPCMNAGGRLDTAKRVLNLLRAKNAKEAAILAGDLKALNDNRKDMTEIQVKEAIRLVEETKVGKDSVLILFLPECHESLAGIVAGRIRERYYKPVFVLTESEQGLKGSGRSIEGYHMYEELHACQRYLTRYGGHKLAAGLSMEKEKLESFRQEINRNCRLTEKELQEKISIDMELPFSAITKEFIEAVGLLEPFGKGNTKPVFAIRNVDILSMSVLGKNKNVLRLLLQDKNGIKMSGVYFGDNESFQDYSHIKQNRDMMFTFYPEINEYRGNESLQIVITHYR